MKFWCVLYCLFLVSSLSSQTLIRGTITDKKAGQVVDAATVSLYALRSNRILAYTQSDEKGEYQIVYNGKQDSLTLAVAGFNL